jgi:uncharacterized SAM-binding protein YcdF (DUF218 family)
MQQAIHLTKIIFRWLFLFLGVFSFLLLVLSFTRLPYDAVHWLGTSKSDYTFQPDVIVFLGGSGMPSEANLIRLYYTSALATKYPKSKVLIVHPKDSTVIDLMREELMLRHVDSLRILLERSGTNTREQAMTVADDFPDMLHKNIVLVTSAENMRRTVQTFQKAGFQFVGGQASFENAMFADLDYDFKKLGGNKFVPDVSSNQGLRYNFWNYLKLEITFLRELTAIAYYKVNGWI